MGAKVKASNNEISTATATTKPKERKKRPISPPVKAMGRKTDTIVRDIAKTGSATSAVPRLAATFGDCSAAESAFDRSIAAGA